MEMTYAHMEKMFSFAAFFLVVYLRTVSSQVTVPPMLVTNCNWSSNSTGGTVLKSPAMENLDLVLNRVCRTRIDAYYDSSLRMKVRRFNLTGPSECRRNSEKFSLEINTSPSNKIARLEWCGSMYPEELILSPNVTGVSATYTLGSYGAGPGFEVELTNDFSSVCYTQQNLIAGSEPKLLYSPYNPSVYKNDLNCVVTIRSVNGQPIWIRSLLMDIENQTECSYDYLSIADDKHCGSNPIDVVLNVASAQIIFHTDSSKTYSGFILQYGVVPAASSCEVRNLTADATTNYYYYSPTGSECYEWHISTRFGRGKIALKMDASRVGSSNSCFNSTSSYMAIYDGPYSTSPQKAFLCGSQPIVIYLSSFSSMTVVFRSITARTDYFYFSYNSSEDYNQNIESTCSSLHYYADASTNYLTLSNLLIDRPTGNLCYEWHISTYYGYGKVSLKFNSLNIRTSYACTTSSSSYVAIYDGPSKSSPLKAILCGYEYSGYYLSSTSNMTVVYRTSNRSSESFTFTYSSIGDYPTTTEIYPPRCEVWLLTAGSSYNYLRSSDVYSSPTGNACYQWIISTYYGYGKVSLDLTSFSVGVSYLCTTSSSSYVAIYDGSLITSPQKAILCGYQSSHNYLSSNSSMTVVYRSSSPTSDYFSLRYSTMVDYATTPESTSCNHRYLTAESSKQYFGSSDVSGSLTRSQCREWHISTMSGSGRVSLDLNSFSLSYSYPCTTSSSSYVEIYEGSTSLFTPTNILCGSQYSGTFQSSSSSMTVVYRTSDSSNEYFSFQYSSQSDNSYDAFSPGIDKGAVVGIIFGSVIGFLIIVGILLFALRWHRRKRMLSESRENLFTNPTSTTVANTNLANGNISMISSPAPFNNGPPPYFLLPHQNFNSAPPPYSSLEFGVRPPLTAPSCIMPSAPRASFIGVAPPVYSVVDTNQVAQLVQNPGPDSVKPEVAAGVGYMENPAYFNYTNPVATEAATAQE